MKIVRENINFKRGLDPKIAMGIGLTELIYKWMIKTFDEEWFPKYKIDENGEIILFDAFEIPDGDLSPGFPTYIRFKDILGGIHLDFCKLKYLSGLPEKTRSYFSCEGNDLMSLNGAPKFVKGDFFCRGNPGKFTKDDVKAVSKVEGKIYSEDNLVNENS